MFTTRTNDNRVVDWVGEGSVGACDTPSVFKRVFARLKAVDGFTLTEVLATVIILGLVTVGMAMAVTVGAQQFNKSMAQSEAQQLYSSLSRLIESDLHLSVNEPVVDGSEKVVSYQSGKYGMERKASLRALDIDGNIVESDDVDSVTGYGELALCYEKDGDIVKNPLLGTGAYNYGLLAKVKSFTYNKSSHYYTVELVIGNPSQDYDVIDETFSVYRLSSLGN